MAICDRAADLLEEMAAIHHPRATYHEFAAMLQIEGFADTILHGAPQRGATVEDGTAAVGALVAISRSVEAGTWVRLDEVTGDV